MKLSIGRKLRLGFGIMLVIIVSIVVTCFILMQDTKTRIGNIHEASQRSDLASDAALNIRNVMVGIRGVLAFGEERFYQQTEQELNKMAEIQNRLLKETPSEKKADVQDLIDASAKWKKIIIGDTFPAAHGLAKEMAAGNAEGVRYWHARLDQLAADTIPISAKITKSMDAIKVYNDEERQKTTQAAVAASNRVISIAAGIGLTGVIIGIILMVLLTRKIRGPVGVMLAETRNFAAGDWREPIHVTTDDEIGELADALNIMRNNTRDLIQQIDNSVEHIASSSQQLTTSAEQSAQAANQVAGSITGVAAGASAQLQAVEKAMNIVEQISAGIQQIATNAGAVAATAERTSYASQEGSKGVEQVVRQMTTIQNSVGGSAQIVTKLGERSKEIGQIVDTISGIAGQTNLLALNAAIEAARAGEQGRGFAVVAEEVRKLAEQSQEAAKQIAVLINEIRGDTEKAVSVMSEGTREVQLGTEVVNSSGEAFGEIATLIEQVSDQVQDISAAIQQMASGSRQIVSSVKEIDEISKDTAGQTQTVSAATEEQSAATEEIASSSHALAELAAELKESVSKFRV